MARLVVLAGQLASMTRAEAARLIALTGGRLAERLTPATSLVIVGGRGPQVQRSGRLTILLARARRMWQKGAPLEVWSEDQWLRSVGLVDETLGIQGRFTAGQAAEALGVSRQSLDRWVSTGLVQPIGTVAGIPVFEFVQVAAARTIAELVQSGVPLAKVRRAIASLSKWLPVASQPALELALDEVVHRLVVRTSDGRLAEPSGQLLLEFAPDNTVAAVPVWCKESDADAFRRAVELEDERPLEAAAIYRSLIDQRGPHATLAFNLGNALFAADDVAAALEHFRQATELNPRHVGAWNNLANALAELDHAEAAVAAYNQALSLDPLLADARFNLAQTLVELGRSEEAWLHWQAYLAADGNSTWADYARERIAATRQPSSLD